MIKIREAEESDCQAAATNILISFKSDFSFFVRCFGRSYVLDFLKEILVIKRFYVAEREGRIVGLLAYSDAAGRATRLDRKGLSRKFGRLRVFLLGFFLKEFEKNLGLDRQAAYLEYVAVAPDCRGQGVASQLLEESMALAGYQTYLLEVKDSNLPAIRCYQGLGFKERSRKKKSFLYPAGDFKDWIWMERRISKSQIGEKK